MIPRLHRRLLIADGVINLILGVLLLAFPLGVNSWLGLPPAQTWFYTSILGAVIFGIGVALFIEVCGGRHRVSGLGLAGAIAINIIGSGVLIIWLLLRPFEISTLGYIILWLIAAVVLGIGLVEWFTGSWRLPEDKKFKEVVNNE